MEINPIDFLVGFILFNLALKVVYPLSGLLHELGHALPSLLLTKDPVRIRLGNSTDKPTIKLGRLEICLGPTTSFWGSCEFTSEGMSTARLIIITLGGPLTSLCLGALFLGWMFTSTLPWEIRLVTAVLFYANCRILLVSIIPQTFRAPNPHSQGVSDGLKILNLLSGEKNGRGDPDQDNKPVE